MTNWKEQEKRILAVIGGHSVSRTEALLRWYRHLRSHLRLPCDVTGIEDSQWEEFYILGPGSVEEYELLRKDQPSYEDLSELTAIDRGIDSEWIMFYEDLRAHVRRHSDDRRFVLGLCELKAVDSSSRNHQLLDDYSVWFINSR